MASIQGQLQASPSSWVHIFDHPWRDNGSSSDRQQPRAYTEPALGALHNLGFSHSWYRVANFQQHVRLPMTARQNTNSKAPAIGGITLCKTIEQNAFIRSRYSLNFGGVTSSQSVLQVRHRGHNRVHITGRDKPSYAHYWPAWPPKLSTSYSSVPYYPTLIEIQFARLGRGSGGFTL